MTRRNPPPELPVLVGDILDMTLRDLVALAVVRGHDLMSFGFAVPLLRESNQERRETLATFALAVGPSAHWLGHLTEARTRDAAARGEPVVIETNPEFVPAGTSPLACLVCQEPIPWGHACLINATTGEACHAGCEARLKDTLAARAASAPNFTRQEGHA